MSNIVDKDVTQVLKIAQKIGNDIPGGIRQLTKTFIDLVESNELIYFGFDSNIHRNRITVTSTDKTSPYKVSTPSLVMYILVKGNLYLMLGTIGDAQQKLDLEQSNFGGDKISEATRKTISDAHDYLCFINTYATNHIPALENHTRYSNNSFNPNTPRNLVQLVPPFCADLITDELRNKYNNTQQYGEKLKMK